MDKTRLNNPTLDAQKASEKTQPKVKGDMWEIYTRWTGIMRTEQKAQMAHDKPDKPTPGGQEEYETQRPGV